MGYLSSPSDHICRSHHICEYQPHVHLAARTYRYDQVEGLGKRDKSRLADGSDGSDGSHGSALGDRKEKHMKPKESWGFHGDFMGISWGFQGDFKGGFDGIEEIDPLVI